MSASKRSVRPKSKSLRYLVVLERARSGYGAYSPDIPGCVATGKTRAVVLRRMSVALAWHLEALRDDGLALPEPCSDALFLEITSD